MDRFFNLNGQLLDSLNSNIQTDSAGLVGHEGVFETMRMSQGKIPLIRLHLDRLFSGMNVLDLDPMRNLSAGLVIDEIKGLCKKNDRFESARIRLQVFRYGTDPDQIENIQTNYLIQSWPLDEIRIFSSLPKYTIDIFPQEKKGIDPLSLLKATPNFLYKRATDWALDNQLDACLVLNAKDRVCDANLFNIFCISNSVVFTPPLSEACVAGVMRRFLMEKAGGLGMNMVELELNAKDLMQADELFLTNAVRGILPVGKFRNREYKSEATKFIWEKTNPFQAQILTGE